MCVKTQIDGDGHLLIPKRWRDRHGLKPGKPMMLMDTGVGVANVSVFLKAFADLQAERELDVYRSSVTSGGEEQ